MDKCFMGKGLRPIGQAQGLGETKPISVGGTDPVGVKQPVVGPAGNHATVCRPYPWSPPNGKRLPKPRYVGPEVWHKEIAGVASRIWM